MTQQNPLFRPEVAADRPERWMGPIRLAQPISGWVIAALAALITCALVAFCIWGTVTKKARVTGMTLPVSGSLSIMVPTAGVLARSAVKEGEYVSQGQILFELSTDHAGPDGDLTALVAGQLEIRKTASLLESKSRVEQFEAQNRSLTEKLLNMEAEAAQLGKELEIAQRRQKLAQGLLANLQMLQASGFVSPSQLQQKEDDVLAASARVSSLMREQAQLNTSRQSTISDKNALATKLKADLAQLEGTKATIDQQAIENQGRKVTVVTAPQSGRVTTIGNYQGQALSVGQVLATLIPGTERETNTPFLEVHLYVPSRTAGFVAIGQEVQIRYQAFPYQMFGLQKGVVVDVSQTPFAPNELPANLSSTILSNAQQAAPPGTGRESLYRVVVKLSKQTIDAYGKPQPIKAGMTLDADIVQEHRKIWEWILAPAIAMAKR
ncbi:HlyD family secretion protein [Undibacterium sp.]|jgi:membrane fusion protein|uniref:HlyD family secretion protein n=1 Tax=Undibacterium sp. TaxID=1914977 RepID=UPI002CEE332E|nr:HlyD family efflux transporter periplasmic adaptor subunit [Undibacterium sp.]HTD05220.1 HlyD family efflux transporter periplasmic adaptor subunit [Undibacterium sp.]